MKRIITTIMILTFGTILGATGGILGMTWFAPMFSPKWPTTVNNEQIADCAWRYFEEGQLEYAYALAVKGDGHAAPIQFVKGYYHASRNEFGKAASFYREAASQGFAPAMWQLACCYRDGCGVANDGKQAIYWAERAGEAGRIEAMLMVAQAYSDGAFVRRSMSKANYWWERAANQGSAEAQYRLAYAYETGAGINRDIDLAAKWYDQARIKGHAQAADGLARMKQAKRSESWARFKEHVRMLFV